LFLCNSFVMDVSRLACCCFSSSLYTSTQEHTVRKLLQLPGMPVWLVRSFCTEKNIASAIWNLYGRFVPLKISQ
jgi:hypothetical protein